MPSPCREQRTQRRGGLGHPGALWLANERLGIVRWLRPALQQALCPSAYRGRVRVHPVEQERFSSPCRATADRERRCLDR